MTEPTNQITDREGMIAAINGNPPAKAPVVEEPPTPEIVVEPKVTDEPPVVVAPVVEEPVVVDPNKPVVVVDPPVVEQSVDEKYAAIVKGLGYESIEDVLNGDSIQKLKDFDDMKSKFDKASSENEMLYKKFGETKNPYNSPESFKVNKLMADNEGMDFKTASKLVSTNFTEMSSLDALLIEAKIKEPNMSDGQAKVIIAKSFGQDTWEDLEDELSDVENQEFKNWVGGKAVTAKRELSKYDMSGVEFKKEEFIPEDIRQALDNQKELTDEAINKIGETWEPTADSLKDFKQLNIPIMNKEGKAEDYTPYVFKEGESEKYSQMAIEFAKMQGFTEVTKENQDIVQEFLYGRMMLDHLPTLIQIATSKAASDALLKAEEERDNSGNLDKRNPKETPPPGTAGKKTLKDAFNNYHAPSILDK